MRLEQTILANNALKNSNVSTKISAAIQKELRRDTDNITADGWAFIEEKAPQLIAVKIAMDFDASEFDSIDNKTVTDYLSDVIHEYEQTHANVRYY